MKQKIINVIGWIIIILMVIFAHTIAFLGLLATFGYGFTLIFLLWFYVLPAILIIRIELRKRKGTKNE